MVYSDSFPGLPACAPRGHPRIIEDWDEEEHYEQTTADAAITALFKYNPAALEQFLDMDNEEVCWER